MSVAIENLWLMIGSILGGVGATLGVVWGVYTHRQNEAAKKKINEAESAKELQALQVDKKIRLIVSEAVKLATEPLRLELHENTQITQKIDLRLTRVETVQFGGNGGGFREELNTNTAMNRQMLLELSKISSHLDDLRSAPGTAPA